MEETIALPILSVTSGRPDGSIQVSIDVSGLAGAPSEVDYYANGNLLYEDDPWSGNTAIALGDGTNASVQSFWGQDVTITAVATVEVAPAGAPAHVTLPAPANLAAAYNPGDGQDDGDGPSVALTWGTIPGGQSTANVFNNGAPIGTAGAPPAIAFSDPNPGPQGSNSYQVAWVDQAGVQGAMSAPVAA